MNTKQKQDAYTPVCTTRFSVDDFTFSEGTLVTEASDLRVPPGVGPFSRLYRDSEAVGFVMVMHDNMGNPVPYKLEVVNRAGCGSVTSWEFKPVNAPMPAVTIFND